MHDDNPSSKRTADVIRQLEAEIEMLRCALEAIADGDANARQIAHHVLTAKIVGEPIN